MTDRQQAIPDVEISQLEALAALDAREFFYDQSGHPTQACYDLVHLARQHLPALIAAHQGTADLPQSPDPCPSAGLSTSSGSVMPVTDQTEDVARTIRTILHLVTDRERAASFRAATAVLQSLRRPGIGNFGGFSRADLDLARQWFDAVEDLHPAYLEQSDHALALRLYESLGLRPSDRLRARAGETS